MKYLLIGMLLSTMNLHASTLEDVEKKVELNFSFVEAEFKIKNQKSFETYVKVLRESIKFPEGPQRVKLEKAIDLLSIIINSDEFRQKVISYTRANGSRSYAKNYLWNEIDQDLSNEDIYDIIMNGDERMRPNTENEMNLNIKKYQSWPWGKVIGWTSPSTSPLINVNWKFYKNYKVHQMVGNLMHEWIHLLGFLHGKQNIHQEVPYVVGRIASDIAASMEK